MPPYKPQKPMRPAGKRGRRPKKKQQRLRNDPTRVLRSRMQRRVKRF